MVLLIKIFKRRENKMKVFLKILFLSAIALFAETKEKNKRTDPIKFKKFEIKKLPPYLKPVYDPIHKIVITRITDYKTFENSYPKHAYSKNQPFNCDSSLIKLQTKWLLDGRSYAIVKKFPKEFHFTTSIWSHKDPFTVFIFKNNGEIIKYNVKTGEKSLIIRIKGFDRVALGPGEGNISLNDEFAALACKKGKDLWILTIDLKKRKIVKKRVFKNKWGNSYEPKYFDWVSISPSGKYIIVLWNKKENNKFVSSEVSLYDKNISFKRNLYDYGNHGDICFDGKGNEMYVQFAGKGSLNAYYLENNESLILYENPELEIGSSRHVSCRNYKNRGWCFVSTEKEGLIIQIKLDGSRKIRYLTSHNGTQETYDKSAMAVSDPFGEKVLFTSDFGDKREKVKYEFVAEKLNSSRRRPTFPRQ